MWEDTINTIDGMNQNLMLGSINLLLTSSCMTKGGNSRLLNLYYLILLFNQIKMSKVKT